MLKPTQNPSSPLEGEAQPRLGYAIEFAQDVVRHYLQVHHRPDEAEGDGDFWGGFRISQNKAEHHLNLNPKVRDPGVRSAIEQRRSKLQTWLNNPTEETIALAQLAALFRLELMDVELLLATLAPAVHPAMIDLYSFVQDDIHRRGADLGFICRLLAMDDQFELERLIDRCRYSGPLRRHRLLLLEARRTRDNPLDLNLLERRIRPSDRVVEYLQSEHNSRFVDEDLAALCVRTEVNVQVDDLLMPYASKKALIQAAQSRSLPLLLHGDAIDSQEQSASALAAMLGKGLLTADLSAMLNEPAHKLETYLADIFREARLGGDLVYMCAHQLPESIGPSARVILERTLPEERFVLGVKTLPSWASAMTLGWTSISVPWPDSDERIALWTKAFEGTKRTAEAANIAIIARRYEMSASQIQTAAVEATRQAQLRRHSDVELGDLDKACRAHFAHQLSDLAQLMPPSPFEVSDLILPDKEKEKFAEILEFAHEQEGIYNGWGFGRKFPYGRGLSVLFYGPPGTGKTMGASVIANALGLDLYRVDVSRIMIRYVGETEKNLAKVFDEAERGRVMLLFDEADALFTKRTAVKSSVDRYANLEVAYLLQRMEHFEGVTVLTTNVESQLDDAFKRRIRYRIYFPMPDAPTRANLWRTMIPAEAPVQENLPFHLLGEHYELSGGYIKQAVLRGAFYARRDKKSIGLEHLAKAAQTECSELGMLVRTTLPKKFKDALRKLEAQAEQERTP